MTPVAATLLGVDWRTPAAFALLAVVVGALVARRRRGAPAVRFAPGPFLDGGVPTPDGGARVGGGGALPTTARTRLAILPGVLGALGLAALVAAIARPSASEPEPLRVEGIDLLLGLDVSSSMTAGDLAAGRTRLDVARAAALDFVRARPHDRIGLLTFARFPDLACPPTLDHAALRTILARVATVRGEGPEDATGIGTAVARAAQALERSPARSKVVVLLTDGEENVALSTAPGEIAPVHAAQLCVALAVRVYAVAIGAGGAGGRRAVDPGVVADVAKRTGGDFFRATDADGLAAAYARIDALERTAIDTPRQVPVDRFGPWLAVALACLVAARVLEAAGVGGAP